MDGMEACEHVLSLAREARCADVDVVLGREESLSLDVREGKVEKVDQSTSVGLGIRVLSEGRTGLAFTERLERDAIETAFTMARDNARLTDATEVVMHSQIPTVPDPEALGLYNPALEALEFSDMAAVGLAIEAGAKGADSRVRGVPYLGVFREQSTFNIFSSHGLSYSQRQNSAGAYCGALLEENGILKTGGHHWHQCDWRPGELEAIGAIAAGEGAALLKARNIPSQQIPVVLDEYCAPGLLGMYFGAFSAEAAQKGQSRLKGRLGEQIAGGQITMLDDPHLRGGRASRYLDAEGVATKALPLIEDGNFANFLYHIESAKKDSTESTGHARRGITGGINTGTHNLVLTPGAYSLAELCALPERCLLVTELEGRAGCNPISGDISIGAQGFLMEHGERVQAVDAITLAGNFFDVLHNIKAIGRDCQPNLSSLFIPALLLEGLTVSG